MRSFIIMGMFVASLAHASWGNYEETRELDLDASGIDALQIDAGAGSLTIVGVDGADEITVEATIQVDTKDEDGAREAIEKGLVLTLEKDGDSAMLKSVFEDGFWSWGDGGSVALVIEMPQGMALLVDDSSGSIRVDDSLGDITIDDSSGSIKIDGAGSVRIDDGSGSITVKRASGDVDIIDGSGSINIAGVGGSVTIDDGSGSINVSDVEHDLVIEDDGSGGLSFSNVRGKVETGG